MTSKHKFGIFCDSFDQSTEALIHKPNCIPAGADVSSPSTVSTYRKEIDVTIIADEATATTAEDSIESAAIPDRGSDAEETLTIPILLLFRHRFRVNITLSYGELIFEDAACLG
ncbi:hypothetical protein FMEXI_1651 [Fusarium mexicanum]|uniref:Uncharacterized protein n=1 Tax=Fusarium mexicanum TaxID=751941 RepID=A0A8H5JI91_9HYPO|nr:hypothetical protein FMEXI_1651 [Fusarium mexicanum]